MGINGFNLNVTEVGSELRFSTKHSFYTKKLNEVLSSLNTTPLKNLLLEPPQYGANESGKDYEDGDIRYIRITDVDFFGNLNVENKKTAENIDDKYMLSHNDFLFARSGNTVGKSFLYDEKIHETSIFAGYFIRFKINFDLVDPTFFLFYTKSSLFELWKNSIIRVMGQPNINAEEYKELPVPIVDLEKQKEASNIITKILNEIDDLKVNLKRTDDIINNVFTEALNFTPQHQQEFEKLLKKTKYYLSFSETANNSDLRFSCKFHNKAAQYLTNFLESRTSKKIKDIIAEPIVLGKGISTNEYDEDGEYYYVAMSNIKNWRFDIEDCKKINRNFYEDNINKTIKKDDILVARSGEGTIGKVALITDEEVEGVFADFTMRIRLRDYNSLFAYYFFRSKFFQYLVYTHKKGLGNNTNIFPSQIQEFPVPDFNDEEQMKIISKIKLVLDKQDEINIKISMKNREILEIVENLIFNP